MRFNSSVISRMLASNSRSRQVAAPSLISVRSGSACGTLGSTRGDLTPRIDAERPAKDWSFNLSNGTTFQHQGLSGDDAMKKRTGQPSIGVLLSEHEGQYDAVRQPRADFLSRLGDRKSTRLNSSHRCIS